MAAPNYADLSALLDCPPEWFSTDFVNYPDLLSREIKDPLEPCFDAVTGARLRIQRTRNELDVGFLESRASSLRERRWFEPLLGLDLAFDENSASFKDDDDEDYRDPKADYLCPLCRSIDLHNPPNRTYVLGRARTDYYWVLGAVGDLARRRSCRLCSFLLNVLQLNASNLEISDSQWHGAWVHLRGAQTKGKHNLKYFTVSLLPKDREGNILPGNNPEKFDYRISLSIEGGTERQQRARPVPATVDVARLQSWISSCDQEHHGCKATPDTTFNVERAKNVKLLDCHSLEVVQAPDQCSYVALSWVWGSFKLSTTLRSSLAKRQLKLDQLPPTIQDATLLVRQLGQRYLWVDVICIDQTNMQEFEQQIAQMHHIYSSATLTIVAASGKDANGGLPGVRPNTRLPAQSSVCIRSDMGTMYLSTFLPDEFLDTEPSNITSVISGSAWNSRAWTYQERIFSRRCLIFTRYQVYLFCRTQISAEDQHEPRHLNWNSIGNVSHFDAHDEMADPYSRFLQQYSSRRLTMDDDALNACFSLLQLVSSRLRTEMCWGLPESDFDTRLLWLYRSNLRVHGSRSKRIFHKRHEFPSWSWAAWSGPVIAGAWDWLEPATTFYEQTTDGHLEPIKSSRNPAWIPQGATNESEMLHSELETQHGYLPIPPYNKGRPAHRLDSGLLVFWAISASFVVTEQTIPPRNIDHTTGSPSGPQSTFDDTNYVACRLPSAEGWRPSLEKPDTYAQFAPYLIVPRKWWTRQQSDSKFEFILIGVGEEQVAILLIERKGDFAYRIAPAFLERQDWLYADNHEWKLIFLA